MTLTNKLLNNWKETTLGEVAERANDQWLPGDSEQRYIGLEHINQGDLQINGFGLSSSLQSNKFYFKQGDILFGKLRPYFRKVWQASFDGVCSTDIWVIRAKEGYDQNFLFYFMANPVLIHKSTGASTGTKMPRADWDFLKRTEWLFPPLPEQKAIAAILSSFDDKIELLRRQNKTLEAMAQAIFKESFVKDKIWDGYLSEYLKVQGGYAFKSEDFKEDGFAGIIKITNITMGVVDILKTQFVDEDIVRDIDKDKFRIKGGDFLIAMTGAEIGKIGIAEKTKKQIWLNQRVGKLVAKVPYGDIAGYLALRSREGQEHIIDAASGSAQANISSTGIEEMAFVPYSETDTNSFGEKVKPLFEKIIFNLSQIQTLSKLRDILLPKLMKGEIRVKPQIR